MKEIEKIFYDDIRDKKRTGRGISHRASRRGYIKGGVKTQYDFLSTKERKKLNGDVRVMNIYDKYKDVSNLPNYDEFRKMISIGNFDEVRKILTTAKSCNTSKSMMKAIGCSSGSLYGMYEKCGVDFSKKPNGGRKKGVKNNIITNEAALTVVNDANNVNDIEDVKEYSYIEKINTLIDIIKKDRESSNIKNGFNISIKGEYNKKEVEDRLMNLTGMLIEGSMYELDIFITEKSK